MELETRFTFRRARHILMSTLGVVATTLALSACDGSGGIKGPVDAVENGVQAPLEEMPLTHTTTTVTP